jgi:signal-transduction protein with cAMP-binding, CBS, and nucleotidyltransferase domain
MILGDELECTKEVEAQARQLLSMPVDPYVQEPHLSLSSDAAALKALALMEQNNTSYMFIVDEWQYRGVVTIQSLARAMFQLDQ